MGRQTSTQDQFFYNFCLDDIIPVDHLVCRIDAVLDLSWMHGELEPYYSHTDRPSIDPELMMRMLIIGDTPGMPNQVKPLISLSSRIRHYSWFPYTWVS